MVAPSAALYTRLRQLRSHRWVPCAWHSNKFPKLRRRPAALHPAPHAPEQSMVVVPARGAREPCVPGPDCCEVLRPTALKRTQIRAWLVLGEGRKLR